MFNFVKKIILSLFIILSFSNYSNAYDRFAKAVIIGSIGCGKTALFNLLSGKTQFKNLVHDEQIKTARIPYNVDGKSVLLYLEDCSGEPRHEKLMETFCYNAHIVFILLNAEDYSEKTINSLSKEDRVKVRDNIMQKKTSELDFANSKDQKKSIEDEISLLKEILNKDSSESIVKVRKKDLETLVLNLRKYAPGCRAVILVTKGNKVDPFDLGGVDAFVQGVKRAAINVDEVADLFLKNLTDNNAMQNKAKINGFIVNALHNYGVNKLPLIPDGFRAEVTWDYEVKPGKCYGENVESKKEKLIVH